MAAGACILTVNGGSSGIKFAFYVAGELLRRILDGSLQRVGLTEATFVVKGSRFTSRGPWRYRTHPSAAGLLMDWLYQRIERGALTGVGHRWLSTAERFPASVAEQKQASVVRKGRDAKRGPIGPPSHLGCQVHLIWRSRQPRNTNGPND